MNTFKKALLEKQRQVGFWLSIPSPYTAEICAGAAFDWLLIDGEHAPNDIFSVLSQLQAIAAYHPHPVVRPVNADPDLLKQLMDIGVQSFLIPMVETEMQAKNIVQAVRYPPQGKRGIGHMLARAARWGRDTSYFEDWAHNACVIVQIETEQALENIEAIAAVDGVDALFIGPADLAASLGHPGNFDHPTVAGAIENALTRIAASGKAAGTITVGAKPALALFDKGYSFIAAGVDTILLSRGTDELARELSVDN